MLRGRGTTPRRLRARQIARASLLGAACLLAVARGAAQGEEPQAPFPEDYVQLLDACRSGQPASRRLAREALAAWNGGQLAQALAGLASARAAAGDDPALAWRVSDPSLAFAAILHTELAFARLDQDQEADARAQLEMARGVLALLPEPTRPSGLKPRWWLAVGCRWRRDFELDTARDWLRRGLRQHPQQAALLLALGSVEELTASFRNPVCPSVAECPSSRAREEYLGVEWNRQSFASAAEQHYREALALEPGLVEARLRLGRLLSLHSSRTRGIEELLKALEQLQEQGLRQLGHLFLGAALEAEQRDDEAIRQYRAALALEMGGQTVRLALARGLRRSGDRGGEREALLPLLATPASSEATASLDPWWLYAIGPQVCREAEWRALRDEVAP